MNFKYIVTAQLGDNLYETIAVEALDMHDAIATASLRLDCTYADIVSAVRVD